MYHNQWLVRPKGPSSRLRRNKREEREKQLKQLNDALTATNPTDIKPFTKKRKISDSSPHSGNPDNDKNNKKSGKFNSKFRKLREFIPLEDHTMSKLPIFYTVDFSDSHYDNDNNNSDYIFKSKTGKNLSFVEENLPKRNITEFVQPKQGDKKPNISKNLEKDYGSYIPKESVHFTGKRK